MPGRLTLNLASQLLPIRSEELVAESSGMVLSDERLVFSETRLTAEYAVTPWLAIGGTFPFRVIDVDVATRDPMTGDPVPSTNIHGRTETLSGAGDPALVVHFATDMGGFGIHARAGTSLPLGHTEENPHLLGSVGQEHQHIQLGTGTAVPFVGIELQRGFSIADARAIVAAWAFTNQSLYEAGNGYQAGDRYSGGLSASSSLGLRRFTFGIALEGYGEMAERWDGMVYTDEGNAGRFDLLAGGSVAWRPLDQLAVVADARYPLYSRIDGTQLRYGVILGVGIAATFDVAPRVSWRGLDEQTIAPAGTAAELEPVPGRVTVFDLWAEWCAPCRELDERLAAIARKNPGKVAVRKLEVIDPESAAWQRHLAPGAFDLPHVKVYGTDGKLLFERTAPPAELARAIEDALR
jgi:thiol-disulfide isomerase/thioredoxin